jgi:hypothetical protein
VLHGADMFALIAGRISIDSHLLQEAMPTCAPHASPFGGRRCWGHRPWREVADERLLRWLWRRLLCDAHCSAWSGRAMLRSRPTDGSGMQQRSASEQVQTSLAGSRAVLGRSCLP